MIFILACFITSSFFSVRHKKWSTKNNTKQFRSIQIKLCCISSIYKVVIGLAHCVNEWRFIILWSVFFRLSNFQFEDNWKTSLEKSNIYRGFLGNETYFSMGPKEQSQKDHRYCSAVHRSQRAGVLACFAGARVYSTPAEFIHLFVLQTTVGHRWKNLNPSTKK
jgi:hypothetical protein